MLVSRQHISARVAELLLQKDMTSRREAELDTKTGQLYFATKKLFGTVFVTAPTDMLVELRTRGICGSKHQHFTSETRMMSFLGDL